MRPRWWIRPASALGAPLVVLLILELVLRGFWSNPYVSPPPVDAYRSRLAMPWFRVSANADGLYEGAGWVYGRTTRFRSLSRGGPDEATPVFALGGSTTETGLVAQGERWPDLLDPPAMNFGTSENCLIDSDRNLEMLLAESGLRPQRVLVMHAVNDLTEILRAPDHFGLEQLPHRPLWNPLEPEASRRVLGIAVRDSWLLSFMSFSMYEQIGRDITRAAPPSDVPPDAPVMGDELFTAIRDYVTSVLPRRDEAFEAMAQLAEQHGFELVLVTQPHAMRPDYRPYRVERRMQRFLRSQFMSHEQHGALLDLMNEHTRSVAARLGLTVVDVARCFDVLDPTPLFYDGVHYTAAGSRAVARCVNAQLLPLPDPGDEP